MKIDEIESLLIGKRIQEMIGEGFRVEITRRFRIAPKGESGELVRVFVQSEELRDTPEDNSRSVKAPTLLEALNKAAKCVRYINGKPSIEAELAKLETEDVNHAAGSLVETGPEACCGSCGSKSPLMLERAVKVWIPWDGTPPRFDPVFGVMGLAGPVSAGEIGSCPDCGKFYRLGA